MKIGILRRKHPGHLGAELRCYRALYQGGEPWRALLDKWLPQHDLEPDKRWTARKNEATYANHAGSIVDFFGSHLFSEPVSVDYGKDRDEPWLTKWIANVDRVGTSFTDWLRALFNDSQVGQTAFAWVNLPARNGVTFDSLGAEQNAGALDAYLIPIQPEQVVWAEWRGAALEWLLLEDLLEERAGPADAVVKTWRWTAITRTHIRTWTWMPNEGRTEPTDEDDAVEQDAVEHRIGRNHPGGRLPVIDLCLPAGMWALRKLADPAIKLLRADNQLGWLLSICANPLLHVADDRETATPTLGAGYFLKTSANGSVQYVEPGGASAVQLADRVTHAREDLYRVVHQLAQAADSNATRAKMSGESKQSDWQAEQIILAAYAALVKDTARRILDLVCEIRGIDSAAFAVGGLEGWQQEDLAAELETMALAVDASRRSPKFQKELAKRQAKRVLVDVEQEVLDEILTEIDESPEVPDGFVDPGSAGPAGVRPGKPPGKGNPAPPPTR